MRMLLFINRDGSKTFPGISTKQELCRKNSDVTNKNMDLTSKSIRLDQTKLLNHFNTKT